MDPTKETTDIQLLTTVGVYKREKTNIGPTLIKKFSSPKHETDSKLCFDGIAMENARGLDLRGSKSLRDLDMPATSDQS